MREHLLGASARAEHARDWRPQILAFSDNEERRARLLTFASWIEGHSGLTTVIRILEGKGRHGRRARINTVLVNWLRPDSQNDDTPMHRRFVRNLHTAFALGCNLLLFDAEDTDWSALSAREPDDRTIDIWWQNNRAGRLMLVLAYLLTRNDEWRGAPIRLLSIDDTTDPAAAKSRLEATLREVRIPGTVEVLAPAADTMAQIVEVSAQTALVFLGLGVQDERFVDAFGHDLADLLPRLPITVLALAADDVDLSADPDDAAESEPAEAQFIPDDASQKTRGESQPAEAEDTN